MADRGSIAQHPAGAGVNVAQWPAVDDDPTRAEMISTGVAAEIIGKDPRTIERWVDARKLRGGRPFDLDTGKPLSGSHRWVDARHAVAIAVGSGRAHLIPEQWRHLIPQQQTSRPART